MASRALVVRKSSTHLGDISQPIAGATDGLDDDLLVLARTEFPAEAAYMGFDDRRSRIEMKIPDMLEQHCPGDNLARMPHQVFKKAEFTGCNSIFRSPCRQLRRVRSISRSPTRRTLPGCVKAGRRAKAFTRAASSANANGLTR